MIISDLIVSWPRNCDYPLWRQYIRDHRSQFNEIIVVFTETNEGPDFRESLRSFLFPDHVLCIESRPVHGHEDWRDVAIQSALLHSYNAPLVMFTEQDFLPTHHDEFWTSVNYAFSSGNDVFGVVDDQRIHPCCLFFTREALGKIEKNFGIVPDKLDHFGLIQKQIENPLLGLRFSAIPNDLYSHMNGLSHNMTLIRQGKEPNWKPTEFTQYVKDCLKVDVPMDPTFSHILREYLARQNTELL